MNVQGSRLLHTRCALRRRAVVSIDNSSLVFAFSVQPGGPAAFTFNVLHKSKHQAEE